MPQSKEVHKEYMRKRRQGSQQGSQIEVNTERAAKLLLLCNALDKETTELNGKRVNLLTVVRYGNLTLEQVKASLA